MIRPEKQADFFKERMERDFFDPVLVKPGGMVYGLVRNLAVAAQITKCANRFGLQARHFDRTEKLIENVRGKKPFLIILDFENCEMEAYKTLKELRENADSKGIPLIGFVTQARVAVKKEAEDSGCDRVYMKTEFARELPGLMTRYAK